MGERESYAPGVFCWVDLGTYDAEGAKAFYGELFGWAPEDLPIRTGVDYTMLRLRGRDVAALYGQEAHEREAGIPPHWSSYISVIDVDEVAARVDGIGGKLLAGPFDVFESGRMAVIQDPTGAIVSLWQAAAHFGAGLVNEPGCLSWNGLATPDPAAAAAFYHELLGWEIDDEPTGTAMITNEGRLNGSIHHEPDLPPHWLPYFATDSLERTTATAAEKGGDVVLASREIGAGRIAVVLDPQGAPFALWEGDLDG